MANHSDLPKANSNPLLPASSIDSTAATASCSSQPAEQSNPGQSPLAIPEVLNTILSFVDRQQLRQCQLVSRFWFQCSLNSLWRWVDYPEVTPTFVQELNKHGTRILCLHINLQCNMSVHMVLPSELTRILQLTPRLKHFTLGLSGPAPAQTTVATFRVISDLFGLQLESLGLSRFDITREAARDFFSGMKKVRTLFLARSTFNTAMDALLESDMAQNLMSFSSTSCNDTMPQEMIGEVLLTQMAVKLPKLKMIHLFNYPNISSTGLARFAAKCQGRLTAITLHNCNSILASDLAAIVEANPFLNHVQFEKCRTNDSVLLKLASPAARAARLQHLSLDWSDHVTSNGIKSIVLSCSNLETLSLSNCKGVKMSIFDEPWSCNHLRILSFGTSSLQTQLSEDKTIALQTGWDLSLKNMYKQLRKFCQMRELNLSRVGSNTKLFELGKSCIDSLKCLEYLTIACNMEQTRTIIWLGTRIPTLTKLVLEGRIGQDFKLLEDIRAINKGLKVDCKTDPLFTEERLQRERETQARALFERHPGPTWIYSTASDDNSEAEREGTPFSMDDSVIHHTDSDEEGGTPHYEEESDIDMDDVDDSDIGMSDLDEDDDLDDIEDEEFDEDGDLDHDEESDYPMDVDAHFDSQAEGSLVDSDDEPFYESDEPAYESDEPEQNDTPEQSDAPEQSDEPEPAYDSDEPEQSDEPEAACDSDDPEPESDDPESAYESDEPEPAYESDEPAYESDDPESASVSDEPVYESDEPAYESDDPEPAYESDGPEYESDGSEY